QAAICDSLERYGAAIEGLKSDMEEATAIAEALRADIRLLGARSGVVSLTQPCTRCGRPISETAPLTSLPQGGALPPFYLFPTGSAYHVACCAAEVTELVAPQQRKR
ncbi:Vacuolar protein sorting-associated protein 18, partial [Tetrabaena socialis]